LISAQPPDVQITEDELQKITEARTNEKETEIKIKAEDLDKTERQMESNVLGKETKLLQ
jgi:hypothetical protein